jgi:hypothetical protein
MWDVLKDGHVRKLAMLANKFEALHRVQLGLIGVPNQHRISLE